MFDESARPWVKPEELTFTAPMKKFACMVHHLEESFVITRSWEKVMRRLENGEKSEMGS